MKLHTYNNIVGCVVQRTNRKSGTVIGIYHNRQAGLDESSAWSTIREQHGAVANHSTLRVAREFAARPLVWCEHCRQEKTSNVLRAGFNKQ